MSAFKFTLRKPRDLYIRVLKELTSPGTFQWNFRESYSTMARRIGFDEETIRMALKRAEQAGLIQGWRLVLNPHFLRSKLAGLQVEVEVERKTDAISKIGLVEGVIIIFDYHGKSLRVVLYYESEQALRRKIELIRRISESKEVSYWKVKSPPSGLRLRQIDWKIFQAVRKDPRQDIANVARKVGVSTRTVNRRLKLMIQEKVACLIAVRNIKNSKGVTCSLLIYCSERGKKRVSELARSRLDRVDFAFSSVSDLFILTLNLGNLCEAEELIGQIRRLEGVNQIKMGVMKEFIFVDNWIDDVVERLTLEPQP